VLFFRLTYPAILAKQGISGQNKEKQNNDKDTFHLPRQIMPILLENK
jgi:hypothetical protein